MLSHPAAVKVMSPGRLVIINTSKLSNVLGAVLKTASTSTNNEKLYTVLVICDKDSAINSNKGESSAINSNKCESSAIISNKGDFSAINSNKCESQDTDLVKPVTKVKLFQPEGASWHEMVQCRGENIIVVTTKTIRLDADKIVNDVKKREQPRFR